MKKHIVAPLALLASISLLTSCMDKKEAVITPVVPPVETAMPLEVVTTSTATTLETPTVSGSTDVMTPAVETPTVSGSTTSSADVKTLTETVSYMTPAGKDEVEFSVTLTDGVITAASSKTLATNDASKYNQDNFAKALTEKVVGKKAADLDVDAIGGASLTTAAFETFIKAL